MSALEPNAAGELYCPTCEQTFPGGDRCPADNTRLVRIARRTDHMLGRELDGRYTIIERLGQGAMGTVYRGTQHSVGRECAIKVVNPALVTEELSIKRFLRESKLASRLAHPNAVSVLDFGQTEDGLFYLVMELVSGRTLEAVLASERALTPPRVVRIGAQICDALEGAHTLDIVHRDLKPANVMIMATGRDLVKVLDFGLAKSLSHDATSNTMTNAGALLGTPAYMPPELISGEHVDGRADLYSLGCILYHAASGRVPFATATIHELIAMHASEPPPPLHGMPRRLAQVIEKLLAKAPGDRYATAAIAREALEAALVPDAVPEVTPQPHDPTLVTGPGTILGWSGLTKSGGARVLTPVAGIPARPSAPNVQVRAQTPPAGIPARLATPPAGVRSPLPAMPALRSPPRPSDPVYMTAPITAPFDAASRNRALLVVGAVLILALGAIAAYLVVS